MILNTPVLGDNIYFENCNKVDIFLTEGVKILGTITGGLFHDKSKNKMYIFKIYKSSLFQVPMWGGRNYLKKKYLKGQLKNPPKLSFFGFQRGVK